MHDKRGGSRGSADFDVVNAASAEDPQEMLAMGMASTCLGELNPEQSRLVEMRNFGGMSVEETAEALGISPRTVKRHGALAKAWLHAELPGRRRS